MTRPHRSLESPDAVHPPVGRYSHLARFKASETLVLAGQVAIDQEGAGRKYVQKINER